MASCTKTFIFTAEDPTEYLDMKARTDDLLEDANGQLSPYALAWDDGAKTLTLTVTVQRNELWTAVA